MKPENKPKYPIEKETVAPKTEHQRRTPKWWRLQYQYKSIEDYVNDRSLFKPKQYTDDWYEEKWSTFIDLDHALQQLNKRERSYSWEREKLKRSNFRLIHLKTQEIIPLTVNNDKFEKHE